MKTEKRDIVSFVKSIKSKPGPAGIPSRCSVAGSVTCVYVPENRATGTAFFCIAIIHSFHSIVLQELGVGKDNPFFACFLDIIFISAYFLIVINAYLVTVRSACLITKIMLHGVKNKCCVYFVLFYVFVNNALKIF